MDRIGCKLNVFNEDGIYRKDTIGLILGVLSRIAALGIGIIMGVAIVTVHWQNGFFMNWLGAQEGEGFEYHLLVIAICVVLFVKGSGAFSLDRAMAAER